MHLLAYTHGSFQRERLHLTEINATQWGLMSRTSCNPEWSNFRKRATKDREFAFRGRCMQLVEGWNKTKARIEEKNNWLSHAVDLTKWGRIVIPTMGCVSTAKWRHLLSVTLGRKHTRFHLLKAEGTNISNPVFYQQISMDIGHCCGPHSAHTARKRYHILFFVLIFVWSSKQTMGEVCLHLWHAHNR